MLVIESVHGRLSDGLNVRGTEVKYLMKNQIRHIMQNFYVVKKIMSDRGFRTPYTHHTILS